MNSKKEGKDLTQGNLLRNMLMVFFPLLLTNILSSIYNFVDGIWIGKIVGEKGISVSVNVYPILFITASVGHGLAIGTSVLVSQHFGAKNNNKIRQVVKVSIIATVCIGFIINLIMGLTSGLWLKIIGTPGEIWNQTISYAIIYLVAYFLNFIMMNIMESIRAIGNSRVPIIFVTITTTLNIILDPILLKTPLGINGAAIATLISIAIGLIIAGIYVNTKSQLLNWNFKGIQFDKELFRIFLKVGVPIVLQEWSMGIVLLLEVRVSNETGVEGSASYGVVNKLEQIISIMSASFKSMVTIFVGQFIGDKKIDETKQILLKSLGMSLITFVVIGLLVYVFPYQLCSIFISNGAVIASAVLFLRLMGIHFMCANPRNALRGFIAGTGHTKVLFIASIVSGIVEIICVFIFKKFGMNNLVIIGLANLIHMFVDTSISLAYYFSKKWKESIIDN